MLWGKPGVEIFKNFLKFTIPLFLNPCKCLIYTFFHTSSSSSFWMCAEYMLLWVDSIKQNWNVGLTDLVFFSTAAYFNVN